MINTVLLLLIAGSAIAGAAKGARGSWQQLVFTLLDAALTVVSLITAWLLGDRLSGRLGDWMVSQSIRVPNEELNSLQQLYYTFLTAIRDFALFRFGFLFMLSFLVVKLLLTFLLSFIISGSVRSTGETQDMVRSRWLNLLLGGFNGTLMGSARALVVLAALFMVCAFSPHSSLSAYIQSSSWYQAGAANLIDPFAGRWRDDVKVLKEDFRSQYQQILLRKYEIIDSHIPKDIEGAALKVTSKEVSDEGKARSLYQWVGTRVHYDWNKVKQYEERQVWLEQSPENTFETRKGVCIDYARLYAVMARAAGLQVKVVTGLGYDGKGGYGPHAWNEVYLSERGEWVPLDATWVSSGGDWFNPKDFYDTHIKEG